MVKDSISFLLAFAIVFFITMLIMLTGCQMAPDPNQKPEAPKNHAPTLDSVIAVESEYHGKEGKSEYGEYEPTLRNWLDGSEKTLLDTMRAIIPNGRGIIEYRDTIVDSIRWSDENVMWIGKDGDTIWD